MGPKGQVLGYPVDISAASVAEENIFYNYDDNNFALVTFSLSNRNKLILYFPEQGSCYLILETVGKPVTTPANFKAQFNCPIGFVPILGPVEHNEILYGKEAARLAITSYQAARNFRNIWYHYPERFAEFRQALRQTWPGMDVEAPTINNTFERARLDMFCPEGRIPREIFWAGFGFQVWCQMLTHLIQSRDVALFLIDEPDIYLHSDLQRQLLTILREMPADILIATHSTEIIIEADADEIVLINKSRQRAKRIAHPSQLQGVLAALGSNVNPVLTQLAKTRRVVFVEGKDFQILGRFASKLGFEKIAARSDFAVVPIDGFNPERMKNFKKGMELSLGIEISAAAVLDRDYRSDAERQKIVNECKEFCEYVSIYTKKEIENFLLDPQAIDRAAERRIEDKIKRGSTSVCYSPLAAMTLNEFAESKKQYVAAQLNFFRENFDKPDYKRISKATYMQQLLEEFDMNWANLSNRIDLIPGKDALSFINERLQNAFGISITPTLIIAEMKHSELSSEMVEIIKSLAHFSEKQSVSNFEDRAGPTRT